MTMRILSECDLDLISAAIDDELSDAEKVWFDSHLAICPGCREEYREMSSVSKVCATLPLVPPPSELMRGIRVKLNHGPKPAQNRVTHPSTFRDWSFAQPLRFAFSGGFIVLFLVLGLAWLQRAPVSERITGFSVVAEAEGEIAGIDLMIAFDTEKIALDPVKLSEISRGFLMESKVENGTLKVSMASVQGIPLTGVASLLEIPVEIKDQNRTVTFTIQKARAYRPDGSLVEVNFRTIPMLLEGISGKDTAA